MTPYIVSIGAATIDFIVTSADFRVAGSSLVLPYSAKSEASTSSVTLGGGGTNSAVSFSRLGIKSICLAPYSPDSLGEFVRQTLKSEKVATRYLYPQPETDFSVILVAPDGGRTIVTARGFYSPTKSVIPWSKIKSASWFYITSLDGNISLLEKTIGFCRENNIKIALNPGRRELSQRQSLLPLLPYLDFLLVNRTESETLLNLPFNSPRFWPALKKLKTPLVAITNGRQGAHIITPDSYLFSPILNTKPVDETGAGDAFGSAFVAALYYRQPLSVALSWAITNSASVVSHLGAKAGLLTIPKLKTALTRHARKTSKK